MGREMEITALFTDVLRSGSKKTGDFYFWGSIPLYDYESVPAEKLILRGSDQVEPGPQYQMQVSLS